MTTDGPLEGGLQGKQRTASTSQATLPLYSPGMGLDWHLTTM